MKNNYKLKGFTLIDIIVGLAISGIILIITVTFLEQTSKTMSIIREKTNTNSRFTRLYGFVFQQTHSSDLLVKYYDDYSFFRGSDINGCFKADKNSMIINNCDTFLFVPETYFETLIPLKENLFIVKNISAKLSSDNLESSFYINYNLISNEIMCDTSVICDAVIRENQARID